MSGAAPVRIVKCPVCGKPASMGTSNRWRPFCGERCRLTDLGAWATESYRVAGKPESDDGGTEGGQGRS